MLKGDIQSAFSTHFHPNWHPFVNHFWSTFARGVKSLAQGHRSGTATQPKWHRYPTQPLLHYTTSAPASKSDRNLSGDRREETDKNVLGTCLRPKDFRLEDIHPVRKNILGRPEAWCLRASDLRTPTPHALPSASGPLRALWAAPWWSPQSPGSDGCTSSQFHGHDSGSSPPTCP